jgi:hypothetical protein
MTTFLERNGMDLAITTVVAPLASYGLHQMFPAPDVRFIAVASTLSLYVCNALRNSFDHFLDQAAKDHGHINQLFVLERFYYILETSTFYFLPIFIKSIGQRVGIQAPDYLPLIGYISLAAGAFAVTKYSIDILYKVYYSKPATK